MIFIFSVLITFSFFGFGQADLCQYNFTLADLNRSVIIEIISFINGYTAASYLPIDETYIRFWLYTRTSVSGTRLNSIRPAVTVRKTILLIHGWSCNITNDLMPELKAAYLKRYNANIIIVDWSYYAAKNYGETFRYIPSIGNAIAKFLMRLNGLGIFINAIHLVGHSMGAQVSAFTGQSLINNYGKTLYRITGLDPGGPIYSNKPSNERLDETDAFFVDVIHTNGGFFGYLNKCGDVDYYPNCGTFQNGCTFSLTNGTFVDFIVQKIACDHLRSVSYMIESINYNNFKAKKSVLLNQLFCYGDGSDISYMGEDSILKYSKTDYVLNTNPNLCQYNFTLADLNRSVIIEIISLISGYTAGSYLPIDESYIRFWLYTRTSVSGTRLNSIRPAVTVRKTILLIHGWSCNITNDLMLELKAAYLKRYNANIIIVDWSYYAAKNYGETFRYIPSIGNAIAKFLMRLNGLGIFINAIHLVGHSMGAQVSAFTGQSLINNYGKTLYRITGLDPGGPIYSNKPSNERLDETDAFFVDVIHTNGGFLGYLNKCGDVDYYPNCGTFQNGCTSSLTNGTFVDFIVQKIACDHLRSVSYMIESINYNNFKAKKRVLLNQLLCYGDGSDISYMGEDSIFKYSKTNYVLYTNPSSPYSQG
ncbi:hypothetical protein RN001_008411 [Aquatica leii]|uniref:Lipase domain-containing protein n=1 Tax=Aquatica leii TaxID=1421715 RepID=A0AAN7Q549_9COLE|nr:hypothetical protein RN001_008411 [Aquatica leii]